MDCLHCVFNLHRDRLAPCGWLHGFMCVQQQCVKTGVSRAALALFAQGLIPYVRMCPRFRKGETKRGLIDLGLIWQGGNVKEEIRDPV